MRSRECDQELVLMIEGRAFKEEFVLGWRVLYVHMDMDGGAFIPIPFLFRTTKKKKHGSLLMFYVNEENTGLTC